MTYERMLLRITGWMAFVSFLAAWLLALQACGPEPGPEPSPTTTTAASTSTAAPVACEAAERATTRELRALRTSLYRDRQGERIVGGEEAEPGAWPWVAALTFRTSSGRLFQYCGGTLIRPSWILTAAHCEVEIGDLVVLGRHDLTTSAGEAIAVDRVLTRRDYDPETNDNDAALVHLERPSTATPAVLVNREEQSSRPGDTATVMGWGVLEFGAPVTSKTLQQVELPLVSLEECRRAYGASITGNMICAGEPEGGVDSCQGDSGGPLVVNHRGVWEQTGIVSFGEGCALPDRPGVYTRVSRYLNWVQACTS